MKSIVNRVKFGSNGETNPAIARIKFMLRIETSFISRSMLNMGFWNSEYFKMM